MDTIECKACGSFNKFYPLATGLCDDCFTIVVTINADIEHLKKIIKYIKSNKKQEN